MRETSLDPRRVQDAKASAEPAEAWACGCGTAPAAGHFGAADVYRIGSADKMHRNLDLRVEVLLRVADPALAAQLGEMIDSCMDPATRCWTLQADGRWEPSPPIGSGIAPVRDHQTEMMLRHALVAESE